MTHITKITIIDNEGFTCDISKSKDGIFDCNWHINGKPRENLSLTEQELVNWMVEQIRKMK